MLAGQKIAVLYQALEPPLIDGLRKDAKPGGYSDGGADIAFALRGVGLDVLTAAAAPDPGVQLDWVHPDTAEGIEAARRGGATLLWANTVLFEAHPLAEAGRGAWIVGQSPVATQRADDKFRTNRTLREQGLQVAASILAGLADKRPGVHDLAALDDAALARLGLRLPLVVKPVRGRGSQGVSVVRDFAALQRDARRLIASARFGAEVMIEEFLGGEELTVTVMPRSDPRGGGGRSGEPFALPPVRRFDHHNGVAPYNGVVAVSQNSEVLSGEEAAVPAVIAMLKACVAAARVVGARAPVRIDCRAGADGVFRIFDLNLKPNLTGAGRPGRGDQDSLCTLAARAIGWTYVDLLGQMLRDAWRDTAGGVELIE